MVVGNAVVVVDMSEEEQSQFVSWTRSWLAGTKGKREEYESASGLLSCLERLFILQILPLLVVGGTPIFIHQSTKRRISRYNGQRNGRSTCGEPQPSNPLRQLYQRFASTLSTPAHHHVSCNHSSIYASTKTYCTANRSRSVYRVISPVDRLSDAKPSRR